ncbi:MAG: glycosyltransferase family 4 protein, partial [Planctomycetes bacterium]|nr:glycosyltransferase family 4 protein [Planctomycetota bacterium]
MAYVEGIPVISTNVGGLAERVKDGETGYVINPGDHQAIANSVVKCFEGDNYAKMSEAARSVAGEQYNWQRIAEQTISVYHS